MKINVTLPDGSVRQYDQGATAMDVAKSISEGLARNVLSAKVNGEVRDANRPLPGDCTLALLTWNDAEGKATLGLINVHRGDTNIQQNPIDHTETFAWCNFAHRAVTSVNKRDAISIGCQRLFGNRQRTWIEVEAE